MAEKRQGYPIRIDMSQDGPGKPLPSRPQRTAPISVDNSVYGVAGRIRKAVGDAASTGMEQMRRSALTNPVTSLPTMLASALGDQTSRIAVRDAMDGLAGEPKGGPKVALVAAPAAAKAMNPIDAAMVAGRQAATTPLSPQEKMLAHLDTLLSRPMTQRGAQAVSGMLPAAGKPVSAKDTVLDTTAQVSQSVYDSQIKDIMARQAAGELDLKMAKEATAKATDAYFLRNTALVANPLSYAQANLMPQPEDPEQ